MQRKKTLPQIICFITICTHALLDCGGNVLLIILLLLLLLSFKHSHVDTNSCNTFKWLTRMWFQTVHMSRESNNQPTTGRREKQSPPPVCWLVQMTNVINYENERIISDAMLSIAYIMIINNRILSIESVPCIVPLPFFSVFVVVVKKKTANLFLQCCLLCVCMCCALRMENCTISLDLFHTHKHKQGMRGSPSFRSSKNRRFSTTSPIESISREWESEFFHAIFLCLFVSLIAFFLEICRHLSL